MEKDRSAKTDITPRAFGYVRVSTLDQCRDGASSIEDQTTTCRDVATFHKMSLADVFADPAVSGSVPMGQREAGKRLLATVHRGDYVICAKVDRGFRDAADALNVAKDLEKRGVKLIVRDFGVDPINTNGTARAMFGFLAVIADWERERIRERTMAGRAAKIAKGGHGGGAAPYGWRVVGTGRDAVREVDAAEQAVIVRAKVLKAAGQSLRQISATLAAEGLVNREGNPFAPTAVAAMVA